MGNILIVDDDAAMREGLAETVADLGHVPQTPLPVERLWRFSPTMTSIAFCSTCVCPAAWTASRCFAESAREQNAPPVIVLTAFATAENTIEAMRLGAFDHLTKPIGRGELSTF